MIAIRLTNPPNDLISLFSGIEKEFYFSYSEFVFSELSKNNVQSFLNMVVRKEKVDLSKVTDVRIMRFPFGTSQAEIEYADRKEIKLEGGTYFGHYIPELRRIDIYPPRFSYKLIKNTSAKQFYDNEEIRCFWFFYQPLKTLVHELLHIKYKEHESTVERLSQKYMNLL